MWVKKWRRNFKQRRDGKRTLSHAAVFVVKRKPCNTFSERTSLQTNWVKFPQFPQFGSCVLTYLRRIPKISESLLEADPLTFRKTCKFLSIDDRSIGKGTETTHNCQDVFSYRCQYRCIFEPNVLSVFDLFEDFVDYMSGLSISYKFRSSYFPTRNVSHSNNVNSQVTM